MTVEKAYKHTLIYVMTHFDRQEYLPIQEACQQIWNNKPSIDSAATTLANAFRPLHPRELHAMDRHFEESDEHTRYFVRLVSLITAVNTASDRTKQIAAIYKIVTLHLGHHRCEKAEEVVMTALGFFPWDRVNCLSRIASYYAENNRLEDLSRVHQLMREVY